MAKVGTAHATLVQPPMRIFIGRRILEVVERDITKIEADAIVNAANSRLMGGGVDGAIHNAAVPSVMHECERIGGCPTGSAVAMCAGRLRAKYILHAVGPEWDDGQQGERDVLRGFAPRTSRAWPDPLAIPRNRSLGDANMQPGPGARENQGSVA